MAEPTKPEQKEASLEPQSRPDPRRRRLLQGGLGAAPLLTLISRPVLGQTQCFTASASTSMPTSQHGQGLACIGRTPGYWKQSQHFDQWRAPYYPGSTDDGQNQKGKQDGAQKTLNRAAWDNTPTRFQAVFSPSPYPAETTLLDVLERGGGPPNDVARHIVAALLNVHNGWAPVLTVPQLQVIWREYMFTGGGGSGYFQPTAGVKWYHDQIVDYLKSTMPL